MVEAGELCMAADSVGQIGLDLVVNRGSFNKQMAGIQSLAKKAGLALAAAFSVKKIWDFGAACVELGSDLAEVQNVVDVTFPQMSKQVNAFAKDAITSLVCLRLWPSVSPAPLGQWPRLLDLTNRRPMRCPQR